MSSSTRSLSPHPYLADALRIERLFHTHITLHQARPGATQNSMLLDLPPELRNWIYELVLINQDLILVEGKRPKHIWPGNKGSRIFIKEPPLLRVCSLIRSEATQLYYSSNKFATTERGNLVRWLNGLTVQKRNVLRDIRTRGGGPATRRDDNKLAWLLREMDHWEWDLKYRYGVRGQEVLRLYVDLDQPDTALSRSEIGERMDEREWEMYWQLEKDLDFWMEDGYWSDDEKDGRDGDADSTTVEIEMFDVNRLQDD